MKRVILFTLFSLLMSVASFSQVQKNFFGATLGVSDLNETYMALYNYFGEKPYAPIGIISYSKKDYAGYWWGAINVHFHNGKFAQVNFRYTNFLNNATSDQILRRYNFLRRELDLKYKGNVECRTSDDGSEKGIVYYDGRYAVSLILRYYTNEKNITQYSEAALWYWDIPLVRQPEQPEPPVINNDL